MEELLDRHSSIDILALTETHIIDGQYDDNDSLFKIPGYQFIKRNRKDGKGGGVGMFIKDGVEWKRRHDMEHENLECIWIEVHIKNSKSILVAVYYRPPEGSTCLSANFNESIREALYKCVQESKEVIILGDFNVNYLKGNENKDFKALFRLYGFTQLIKQATRIAKDMSTLIDIILSNNPKTIGKSGVFMNSLSDHEMVGCIRKLHQARFAAKVITCRNYSKYEPEEMKEDFRNVNWEQVYNTNDVNEALTCFNRTVKAIFDRHAPQIVKRVKGKPCPWMNSDTRKMMTSRDRMLRKARRTKKEEHWNLYKKLRNQCNNKMKYAKSSFHKETLEENSKKPRRFWNTIKNVFPTKPKQMTTNLYRANDPNRPTMFSTYFASVVRMLKNKAIPLVDFVWRQPVALLSRTDKVFKITVISRAFIVNELKHFKRNKATGVDEL